MATTDSIPIVDLNLLTQSEIRELTLTSPNAFNLDTLSDVVPKIDRSVFNESAGSRKQTYSRLPLLQQSQSHTQPQPQPQPPPPNPSLPRRRGRPRLHPLPNPNPSPKSKPTPPAEDTPSSPDLGHQENLQIVGILKKLFAARERSDADRLASDRELSNVKGEVVDVAGLAGKKDLFGEELRRRTEGLTTEDQILGYMTGLDGQWGSRRKKRKVVEAALLGDALPKGWKVLLGLKRKGSIVYLACKRYVSPSGKQFTSCKEVSSYIISLSGDQDSVQPISCQHDESVFRPAKLTPGCVADHNHQNAKTRTTSDWSFITPISYASPEYEKQGLLCSVEKKTVPGCEKTLECQKCCRTFGEKDAHMQHLLICQQKSAKRRKLGKSLTDGVIVKDGKYECQFCHKTFSERHRYNGHIGAHIRYQGLTVDAVPDNFTFGVMNKTSSAVVPYVSSDKNVSANKGVVDTSDSVDVLPIDFSQSIPTVGKNEDEQILNTAAREITEPVSSSISVDSQIKDYSMACDESKETAKASDATAITSNAPTDVISPPAINLNSVSHACLPDVSQENPTTKSVHESLNEHEVVTDRVIEDRNIHDEKRSLASMDSVAPDHADMDVTITKTVSENGLSSNQGQNSDPKLVDFKLEKNDDISETMGIEFLGEAGQSCAKNKLIDQHIDGFNAASHRSEVVDTTGVISVGLNACTDALSPSVNSMAAINHDNHSAKDLSSCIIVSATENYSGDETVYAETHLLSVSANTQNFDIATLANDIFTSAVEEHGSLTTRVGENNDNCDVITNRDTSFISTMHGGLNSCIIGNIAGEPTSGIETNAECMFPGDLNKSLLEGIDGVSDELQNCFHSGTDCDMDTAGVILNNGDENQVVQDVAGASTPWGQSSDTLPILDMFPGQSEGELHSTGDKNEEANMSGFEDLRLGGIEPADFVLFTGQASGSAARSPIEFIPDDQLGWGISLTKMDAAEVQTAVCVWCNREFSLEGVEAEPDADSVGYMCPDCKAKISGQFSMLHNDFL